MEYAIIRSGNKQYQVKAGSLIRVELLGQATGDVAFDQVLLHVNGDNLELGTPTLAGFKVYGSIVDTVKADKIQVFKYKSKSRYRKLRGHRQKYTLVKITSLGEAKAIVKTKKTTSLKTSPKKAPVKKKISKTSK